MIILLFTTLALFILACIVKSIILNSINETKLNKPFAYVASLHLHPQKVGDAMITVPNIQVVRDKGILGNPRRHYNRKSKEGESYPRQVSLIERELLRHYERLIEDDLRRKINSARDDISCDDIRDKINSARDGNSGDDIRDKINSARDGNSGDGRDDREDRNNNSKNNNSKESEYENDGDKDKSNKDDENKNNLNNIKLYPGRIRADIEVIMLDHKNYTSETDSNKSINSENKIDDSNINNESEIPPDKNVTSKKKLNNKNKKFPLSPLTHRLNKYIQIGSSAVLKISMSREPCWQMDRIYRGLQNFIWRDGQGTLARIVCSGDIKIGDRIFEISYVNYLILLVKHWIKG